MAEKSTNPTPVKKEQERTTKAKVAFLERFFKATGNIKFICEQIGIDRSTFYNWVDNDPDFKAAIDAEREGLIDFTESKLFNLINDKNPTAIIFFLKTKAKHRGYVERQEHDHAGKIETGGEFVFRVVDHEKEEGDGAT